MAALVRERSAGARPQGEEDCLALRESGTEVSLLFLGRGGGRQGDSGRDKLVHCLEAKTGKPLREFTTRARAESSPAVAGGRVYVGSTDGRLYVLDARLGGWKGLDRHAGWQDLLPRRVNLLDIRR